MKTILLLLILLPVTVFAQLQIPIDTTSHKISQTQIIEVDSVNKRELFSRAVEWVTLNYKSANDVIQMKDEVAGKIIVKGFFEKHFRDTWPQGVNISVYHTIIISMKDGKCRIQITDMNYKYYEQSSLDGSGYWREGALEELLYRKMAKEGWQNFVKNCCKEVTTTIESFSVFMQKPQDKQSDNW